MTYKLLTSQELGGYCRFEVEAPYYVPVQSVIDYIRLSDDEAEGFTVQFAYRRERRKGESMYEKIEKPILVSRIINKKILEPLMSLLEIERQLTQSRLQEEEKAIEQKLKRMHEKSLNDDS